MGMNRLVRKVRGEDLFAKAANYHKTCFKEFRLTCLNFQKVADKATESSSATQPDPVSAHDHAFNVIFDTVS